MPEPTPSNWQEAHQRAISETDTRKLPDLLLEAENQLFLRTQQLASSSDHHEERRQMHAAANQLLVIRVKKLGWPALSEQAMREITQTWRIAVRHALAESGPEFSKEKLRNLVLVAEEMLFNRSKEIANSSDHHEERREMKIASAELLAIKIGKLGYPKV